MKSFGKSMSLLQKLASIVVKFCQLGVRSQKYYTREYYTVGTKSKYAELNNNDSFAILDTVTKITVQFIKEFSPERIEIDHIPTLKERQDDAFIRDYLANKAITKRAIANKRFLERDLPHNYSYELAHSISLITKNPS